MVIASPTLWSWVLLRVMKLSGSGNAGPEKITRFGDSTATAVGEPGKPPATTLTVTSPLNVGSLLPSASEVSVARAVPRKVKLVATPPTDGPLPEIIPRFELK
jgi:hypothetical protein